MNWITGIQKAIDYTEEHLEEEIDFEKVAEETCSSSFKFHRIFTALCGISLGEYIRNRRLSRAAEILATSDAKVIDVAFRFCYETPESFTRAFTRFHGITPREAKRGDCLKTQTSSVKIDTKLVKMVLNMDLKDKKMTKKVVFRQSEGRASKIFF